MLEVDTYLEETKSSILHQVHDDIICEVHNSELETIPLKVREILEINSLDIPLVVDMEICDPSWATKTDFAIKSIDDYIDWSDVPFTDKDGIEW